MALLIRPACHSRVRIAVRETVLDGAFIADHAWLLVVAELTVATARALPHIWIAWVEIFYINHVCHMQHRSIDG